MSTSSIKSILTASSLSDARVTPWKKFMEQDTSRPMSLQGKIRQMLVTAIFDGYLCPGRPIPSTRELAEFLGVARNTVVIAYQQLVDEGYLTTQERKGYFINPDILQGRASLQASQKAKTTDTAPDWGRRFRFRPSLQRNIEKRHDWQDYPYPFLYGQFDPSLFPTADWRECCMKTLSVLEIKAWAQDMILRDDDSLVQQIRTKVLPRRGVWASEAEIVITVGTQQALYLLADLLVSPDTPIGIEDPGYPDARNIFNSRSTRIIPLPIDGGGMVVDDHLAQCDYVYVTPSHQCPTTITMPVKRRQALLDKADTDDFIIIEDDYESENPFEGEPLPTLKSLDQSNRVIYVGSLSKSLAPGLRLGYIVGPPELICELRGVRRLNLRHPAAFMQRAFSLFLSLGHHDALLRRLAAAHHERARVLNQALNQHLPQFRHIPISGGSSCWIEGPAWLDTTQLALAAAREGILIEPGGVFFMSPHPPENYFRLGFSSISADHILQGIAALARVITRLAPLPPA